VNFFFSRNISLKWDSILYYDIKTIQPKYTLFFLL